MSIVFRRPVYEHLDWFIRVVQEDVDGERMVVAGGACWGTHTPAATARHRDVRIRIRTLTLTTIQTLRPKARIISTAGFFGLKFEHLDYGRSPPVSTPSFSYILSQLTPIETQFTPLRPFL